MSSSTLVAKSVRFQRRWSLSLIVVMLLHWSFGACAAIADTLCLEPSGQVVWEKSGQPCATQALEQTVGKHCIDVQTHDGHGDHAPVPSKMQIADAQTPGLIPALTLPLPARVATPAMMPDATGPPAPLFSLVVRETAYLLI